MKWIQKHKRLVVIVLFLSVLCCIGWSFYQQKNHKKELVLYGNVDIRQVSLAFNGSGRIHEMLKNEGDKVAKGDVLATLDARPLEIAIDKAEAAIAAQEAQVQKLYNGTRSEEIVEAQSRVEALMAEENNAHTYYGRMLQLLESGAVSQQAVDNAEARWKGAEANLNYAKATLHKANNGARSEDILAAEAQLKSLQATLDSYKYNLSQTTLVAPDDGLIRSRLSEVGDMASPQAPVYILSLTSPKWIRAYVTEDRLGEIHEGMKAKVYIDSFPNEFIEGQIGYISHTAEFTPKNVQTENLRTALVYEVRIYVDDIHNRLRIGMPATIKF